MKLLYPSLGSNFRRHPAQKREYLYLLLALESSKVIAYNQSSGIVDVNPRALCLFYFYSRRFFFSLSYEERV